MGHWADSGLGFDEPRLSFCSGQTPEVASLPLYWRLHLHSNTETGRRVSKRTFFSTATSFPTKHKETFALRELLPHYPVCDTRKIITTSIHTLTDNGNLSSTIRVHNLALECHWNPTETTAALRNLPRRRASRVSLRSWSLLNYQPPLTATNKLSREGERGRWEGGRDEERGKPGLKNWFQNVENRVEVCFH